MATVATTAGKRAMQLFLLLVGGLKKNTARKRNYIIVKKISKARKNYARQLI